LQKILIGISPNNSLNVGQQIINWFRLGWFGI